MIKRVEGEPRAALNQRLRMVAAGWDSRYPVDLVSVLGRPHVLRVEPITVFTPRTESVREANTFNPSNLLSTYAAENRRLMAEFEGLDKSRPSAKELFEAYKESSLFRDAYVRALELAADKNSAISEMKSGIAGRIFEDTSFILLSKLENNRGNFVTTPAQTLVIWRKLYPGVPVINHEFTKSLAGIHVPDAIVFKREGKEMKIVGVVEASAAQNQDRKHLIEVNQFQARKFPQILGDSHSIFVEPANLATPKDSLPDATVIQSPITSQKLRGMVDYVIGEYRPQMPTIREAWNRVDRTI